jgi:hypothetical protein
MIKQEISNNIIENFKLTRLTQLHSKFAQQFINIFKQARNKCYTPLLVKELICLVQGDLTIKLQKNSLNQLAINATCYAQLIIKNGEMKIYIVGYQITFSLCAQQHPILVMRCCKKHRILDCLYCYYECQKKKIWIPYCISNHRFCIPAVRWKM